MAKKAAPAKKKISELSREELEVRLSEETDEEKKELIQLRLDEMSEDDGSEDDEEEEDAPAPKAKPKKPAKEMNLEELQEAHQQVCDELAEIKKGMAKTLAETRTAKKEADFTLLLSQGKVVPAQKKAFMADDTAELLRLAETPKFTTVGSHGGKVNKDDKGTKTSAQDEVLKLADEAVKAGKAKARPDAIGLVLSENRELNNRYEAEMNGQQTEEVAV